jgi:hypothetical protein
MQNLKDSLLLSLDAPAATLQLAEKAKREQQTAQFIQIIQNQIVQLLSNPQVAANPQLLQV